MVTLFATFAISSSYGQDLNTPKKNAIHIVPGSGLFWFGGTLSYERRFSRRTLLRSGIGKFVSVDGSGYHFFGQYGLLLGKKHHKLEVGAGPAYIVGEPLEGLTLSMTGGYRYQKPDGWFIFRTGASYPEFYYVSFGVAF